MSKIYTTVSHTLISWYTTTWEYLNSMSQTQWLVFLGVVTTAGFFCMRGFGSRTNY